MGSLEVIPSHRDHLPALGYLGKDRSAFSQIHSPVANGSDRASTPLLSPTTMYSGQPPPYSYSTPAHNPGASPGYISPPDSRRAFDEEKEKLAQQQRQSLPSIHEALGNENPLPYAAPPTSAPPAQQAHAPPRPLSSSLAKRPSADGPSGPPNPFSSSSSGSMFRDPQFQQPPLQADVSRSSMNTQESRNPSLNSLGSSGRSPTQSAKTGVTSISGSQPSSGYEYSAPPSAGSVASPNGFGTIPPSFSFQSQPPPNAPSYPASQYDPRSYMGLPWKPAGGEPIPAEDLKGGLGRPVLPGHPYGDSVKRHLDIYDVEASLNEIAEMSTRTLDFSRHYAIRAHQTQRSGPGLGSVPSLGEVEEMMSMQRRSEEAMMRIRTAAINQEHAMAEQMAQRRAFKPGMPEDDHLYQEEYKGGGGFAGAESKKRRGKAAPPGRCHSCNRAETPEWRRGPDGARTLCNACGLHYAKLTRKMGANKASSMGTSLKPKSASPSSH